VFFFVSFVFSVDPPFFIRVIRSSYPLSVYYSHMILSLKKVG